jgi:hypothetical protein
MDSGNRDGAVDSGSGGGIDSGGPDGAPDAGAPDSGSPTCTGSCLQQQPCPGSGTTSVTGVVYAPNGVDPLPNALVYVPNGGPAPSYGVQPFAPGVACGACGADVSGSPLVETVTGVNGSFTLTDMPVGANIPLVIQIGRWRRKINIPTVAACAGTSLAAAQTSLPSTESMGDPADNIPRMAFATGSVDALECMMRKIGVADTQFTDPGGVGRINFYVGVGVGGAGGAQISASTPNETQLWDTPAAIDKYDMVYFPCQGGAYTQSTASQQVLVDYANAGGRVFATHYSYAWLYNNTIGAPNTFESTATWKVDPNDTNVFGNDPGTGIINQTFADGQTLAEWLNLLYPTSTLGQVPISTLRHDFTAVAASPSAHLWISDNDPSLGNVPMHYTFDTPVGLPAASQCGRVLYDDFHVEDAENNPTTGMTFPAECNTSPMTPQEKMLEFMIFDLGSCVTPSVSCAPKTCGEGGVSCGVAGDGCGNILSCGMCPSGTSCVAGACTNTCTPRTCQKQGFTCGMQGNGCGNIENCGTCPSGMTCIGARCESGACAPSTSCPPSDTCGNISDGCSGTLNCGPCPSGQGTCGGGGTPNQCGSLPCIPKNCAQQEFNCGLATDGCGNVINCGTCTAPQSCGAGTPPRANVCGGGSGS